uniref:Uncharacterized protein n=1 Tax=Acrobeloides nanus TaxID=290746 RepID=A0A914C3T8_9BILA
MPIGGVTSPMPMINAANRVPFPIDRKNSTISPLVSMPRDDSDEDDDEKIKYPIREAVARTMNFLIVVVGVKELVPTLIPFVQRSVILTTLVAVAETALSETETAVVFVRAVAPITILLRVVVMKFLIVVVGVKELVPTLIPFVQRSVMLTTLVAVAETALSETETAVVFVRAVAPIIILLHVVEMKIGMNVVDVKQPATIPIHLVHLSVELVLAVVEMDGFAIKMETASIHNSVSPTNVVKELAQILVLLACLIVNLAASRDVNALFLVVLFETISESVFLRLNVRIKILQAAVAYEQPTCIKIPSNAPMPSGGVAPPMPMIGGVTPPMPMPIGGITSPMPMPIGGVTPPMPMPIGGVTPPMPMINATSRIPSVDRKNSTAPPLVPMPRDENGDDRRGNENNQHRFGGGHHDNQDRFDEGHHKGSSRSCRQDNEFFDRCGGCESTCTNPNIVVILTTLVAVAETALSETETAIVFLRETVPITILLRVVGMKFGMNVVDVKQPATIPIHLVHLTVDVVLAVVEMDGFAIQMEIASIDNSVSLTNVDRMKFSTDVVQVVKELAQILVLFACLIVNLAASRDVNALFLMVLFEIVLEIVFLRLNARVKILQILSIFFLISLLTKKLDGQATGSANAPMPIGGVTPPMPMINATSRVPSEDRKNSTIAPLVPMPRDENDDNRKDSENGDDQAQFDGDHHKGSSSK